MKCFLCDSKSTSVEHVPARSFFPKNKRFNLITVPSCEKHNLDTSLDDEYIRDVIAMAKGTNSIAVNHFRDKGIKSLQKSPALANLIAKNPKYLNFIKDNEETKNLTYQVERPRFDRVLKKIAYGLYFHKYKSTWNKELAISTDRLITENYEPDIIAEELKRHPELRDSANYEGNNPDVFKFSFLDFSNRPDKFLLMNFYEYFEIWALPLESSISSTLD